MKTTWIFAALVMAAQAAGGQGLPRPKLPCECNSTGVCTCLKGLCECVACRLSAEKAALVKEAEVLRAEVLRLKAEVDRLKAAPAAAAPVYRTYPAPVYRTYPAYSPPPVYRAAPTFGVPVSMGTPVGGAACAT